MTCTVPPVKAIVSLPASGWLSSFLVASVTSSSLADVVTPEVTGMAMVGMKVPSTRTRTPWNVIEINK